ncbi:AraC family ligand binding domain-containing protein [Hwanghaeella sp.]|uniref:AraC family ligand binding domain-containing protein n=1 Tax=Hwanghaeella sp. TaxID=2605943 RepID=UPI003CCB9155
MAGSPSQRDWVRHGDCPPGMERHEAYFAGFAYEPHRHDTYAIGFTVEGVQSFGYRGTEEHSLPGHVLVIHPDELHDGHAGTEDGFRFRMLYLRPDLIRDALSTAGPGGGPAPLPFIPGAISRDARLIRALMLALGDMETEIHPLEADRIIQELSDALNAVSGSLHPPLPDPISARSTGRVITCVPI